MLQALRRFASTIHKSCVLQRNINLVKSDRDLLINMLPKLKAAKDENLKKVIKQLNKLEKTFGELKVSV